MRIMLPAQRPVEWALELTLIDTLKFPAIATADGVLVKTTPFTLKPSGELYAFRHRTVVVGTGFTGYVDYVLTILYRVWLRFLFGRSTGAIPIPQRRTVASDEVALIDVPSATRPKMGFFESPAWLVIRIYLILYSLFNLLGIFYVLINHWLGD